MDTLQPIEVQTKRNYSGCTALVWLTTDGHYMFTVSRFDGLTQLVAGGGADNELSDYERLVDASIEWIDWSREGELLNSLARWQRARYSGPAQLALAGVFA